MERKGTDQDTTRVSMAGMLADPSRCSFVRREGDSVLDLVYMRGNARSFEKTAFSCLCVFIQNMNTDF